MDFASGFGMTMACLCIFMNEWVKLPLAKLQIDIKRVSSWRKCSDFCSSNKTCFFSYDVNFMNFQLFFWYFFYPAFQSKTWKTSQQKCVGFCDLHDSMTQWPLKTPFPNAKTNRENQTQEEGEVKPEAGMSSLDRGPPGSASFHGSPPGWHEPF